MGIQDGQGKSSIASRPCFRLYPANVGCYNSLMSTLVEIEAAADALPSEQKQELLLFLAASLRKEKAVAQDSAYERGYSQTPEDLSLTHALMPHLAVDPEDWE
jgi:hypothetical protein